MFRRASTVPTAQQPPDASKRLELDAIGDVLAIPCGDPTTEQILLLLQDGEAIGQCVAAGQGAEHGFACSDSRSDAGGQGGCVG